MIQEQLNVIFDVQLHWLAIVFMVMGVDLILGFAQAVVNKNLLSKKMSDGIIKKLSILILIVAVNFIVNKFPDDVANYTMLVIYITEVVNELISIVENMEKMGLKVEWMEKIFELLKNKEEK